MKSKPLYVCSNCGATSPSWMGKCSECQSWGTLVAGEVQSDEGRKKKSAGSIRTPVLLSDASDNFERVQTKIGEVDLVFGGGITVGSLSLLSGEPGVGKSTLTLELCDAFLKNGKKVLYVAGEESPSQIANRASRIGVGMGLQVITETSVEDIMATAMDVKPDFLVIDSIQVVSSDEVSGVPGSVLQVRYSAERFMTLAKDHGITTLLIGHVTKDGTLAGPRVLEHLVDTVLFLEGDRTGTTRILKTTKNRFGPTDETGIFQMSSKGLVQAKNPLELFTESEGVSFGTCLTAIQEGSRTFVVEIQALVAPTKFGYPKRTVSGIDLNRLNIITAVLSKHAGVHLDSFDIFVTTVGDFNTNDRSVDLAIALALVSSKLQKSLAQHTVAIGEIGLTGNIRPTPSTEKKLKDIKKMGFTIAYPRENEKTLAVKNLLQNLF